MTEDRLTVDAGVEDGVVILTVHYPDELMFDKDAVGPLRDELRNKYVDKLREAKTRSCVVVIEPDVAGSPLVRALYELWKLVVERAGQVICVDYPDPYISILSAIGLPSLPGFSLRGSKEQALDTLRQK